MEALKIADAIGGLYHEHRQKVYNMTAIAKTSIEECYKKMAWAIHELSNCIIVIRGESLFLQEETD